MRIRAILEPLESRQLLSAAPVPAEAAEIAGPRIVENLGRGVVAVRSTTNSVAVSWRLLALDPSGISFNLYRSANDGAAVKLNGSPLTAGTNYIDTNPNLTQNNAYFVRPVVGGVEQPASGFFTLKANSAIEPIYRIPIASPMPNYWTKFIWVGDLDGDGEYDFVLDRLAPLDPTNDDIGLGNQYLEAYRRDGTKLWSIDMGPTSRGTYNISPGAATLSMGMWDGVTVQDLNSDGKAEVILKIANGVVFPDGSTFTTTNDQRQFISVLDGMTGNRIAQLEFPTDHAFAGRLSTMLGVGYLDGVRPSIVAWLRNRNPDTAAYGSLRKQFNDIIIAWDWNGGSAITQKWKLPLKAGDPIAAGIAGFHQMRIVDVNGDGCDDVLPGNYAVSGKNGQILYKIAGIGHGDRFHVGDFDPDRPGLEGFGIQQNDGHIGEAGAILDYYYDAGTGQILWTNNGVGYDVGRGAAGDVDPTIRGFEVWSFEGMHNGPTHALLDDDSSGGVPWPNLRIWWDGDLLSEELDGTVINKYNYTSNTTGRLVTAYRMGAHTTQKYPMFYGDILGDWREEAVYMNTSYSELLIFTTNSPTATRLYTLPQNPAYRNSMTVKGYVQSHQLDYYLGDGMTAPPTPNVVYQESIPPTVANVEHLWEPSPNQLRVQFSEAMDRNSLISGTVVDSPDGSLLVLMQMSYEAATNIATFTLPGALGDGNYTLRFTPGLVKDVVGNQIDSTYRYRFFVLAGDANHDRTVNIADLRAFASNFGQSSKTFSQGDFDYDGDVDRNDLAILTRNWQTLLEPPPPPAPVATSVKNAIRPTTRVAKLVI